VATGDASGWARLGVAAVVKASVPVDRLPAQAEPAVSRAELTGGFCAIAVD
jgi:hypothetical protein